MSIKRTLVLRTTLFLAAFCLTTASYSAFAEDRTSIVKLLQSGYEVKAAYMGAVYNRVERYLVLQKGASTYQCTTDTTGIPNVMSYANTYSCVDIQDLAPATKY